MVDGRLKVLTTSVLGDDVVFNVITPGEVIGEGALLTGSPRTATIVAMEPCELIVIDRRDFLAFLRSHAEAAVALLEILALRLKGVSELVEDTQFLNLPLRLAKKLSAFAREAFRHDARARQDVEPGGPLRCAGPCEVALLLVVGHLGAVAVRHPFAAGGAGVDR